MMAVGLDEERTTVVEALRRAMDGDEPERSRLLGVKGRALLAATAADRNVLDSPTRAAIERYTGVLYDAADFATLAPAALTTLTESVVILSGLWGLVRPLDPVPDYKLKMGANLPPLGRLARWWRDPLSARLRQLATGRRVWNLLPKEHDAAVAGPLGSEQISVTFLERNDKGELVAVSHWNKFLKGALVRHLLEHPGLGPEDLDCWQHPAGYRLDRTRSANERDRLRLYFVKGG